MDVHFYTSVHLSSRVGGGLMLRLEMSPDTASPLHFATELLGGGYLIFERMSDAAVGVGAVYEAVRAVEDLDPDYSTVDFNPIPKTGGSSGEIVKMRATFEKIHEDRLKVQEIVSSLIGEAPGDADPVGFRISAKAVAEFMSKATAAAVAGKTGLEGDHAG